MASTIDSGGGGSAAATTFTADGDITSTDVQAAIVEVRDDTDGKLATKADTSALTAHTSATANPHATSIANLGAGTLAQLNVALTGATLDEAGTARPPTTHASDHVGGSDPIPNATAGTAGLMPAADKSKLDGYPATPAGFETTSSKGVAGGYASLDGGGKIPAAQIPAVALPTVSVVADATARLALTVEEGDEAVQTDDGSHWIYDGTTWIQRATAGTGDVLGPAGATADELAVFDGLTGKVLKGGSGVSAAGGNITLSGTVDGRDVAADGGVLDAHVAASNPHAGSLSTSHEGAGGAVHAAATTGAAGFMSAADKAKVDGVEAGAQVNTVTLVYGRAGAVVSAASDYDASQVDNDSAVAGATVAEALDQLDTDVAAVAATASAAAGAAAAAQGDATTALGNAATAQSTANTALANAATAQSAADAAQTTADAKAAIAGQLGGTAASPDVRGVRTTEGGGTLLTLGAVADGEYLLRSGTTIIGGTPAGGGGGSPSIDYVEGVSNTDNWSESGGSDPLTGTAWTMSSLQCLRTDTASGFARRIPIGTRDTVVNSGGAVGGGACIYFLYGRLFGYGFSFVDNGGNEVFRDITINVSGTGVQTFLQNKVVLLHLVFNGSAAQLYANGSLVDEAFVVSAGAITAGGALGLGATAGGAAENGIDAGGLNGGGYVTRAISEDEVQEHLRASMEANRFESIPGGGGDWTRSWRVDGGDPGASWAPFVGAGALTRNGSTAPTYRAAPNPQWR